jgi:hypothetical protein
MCCFCWECGAIYETFWRMKGEAPGGDDPLALAFVVQDAGDWRRELASLSNDEHVCLNLIALCRHWSERIAGSEPAPLSGVLTPGAMHDLRRMLATVHYPPEWLWVLSEQGAIPCPVPIEVVRARLDFYIASWLVQSSSGGTDWDRKSFHDNFLSVSVAFDVLMRAAPDDPRFKTLSIQAPDGSEMLDLWMQRRAVGVCVAHSGIQFIKANYDDLRLEAILSAVWSDLLDGDALRDLHTWVQGRTHGSSNIDPADFVEAIGMTADLAGRPTLMSS